MQTYPITKADLQLVELATETIQSRYADDKHHVAAALRTKGGATKVGVHVEAYIGRICPLDDRRSVDESADCRLNST